MFTLLLSKWLNRVLHDLILSILSYNRQEVLRPLEDLHNTSSWKKKEYLGEFIILITYPQSNYPLSRDSWAKLCS